ncbi:MAG: hypothetical protein ACPGJR_11405 [Akkermansiaceae bacterium]
MSEKPEKSKVSGIKVTLAVVPALLVVSIIVALYLGANADKEESQPFEGEVTTQEMSGYLKNVNEVIGERRIDTEEGQACFRQLRAMIKGALGPQNLGYEVLQTQLDTANGLLWPTLWITAGNRESKEVVVMAIPQIGSGTPAALGFGLAEYLAGMSTVAGIRIVFYPPLQEGDFEEWIWKRCGREGESLKGILRVSGGDPMDRVTILAGPARSPLLQGIKDSKLWRGGLLLAPNPSQEIEVKLIEQGGISREEHAGRLIQLFPLMKTLLDRMAR